MALAFNQAKLFETLEAVDNQYFDDLDFGVIKMDRQGSIKAYNKCEANLAANDQQEVLGKNFFTQVAPCTNNFMVAERYSKFEEDLDELVDYVFTYRIKPTPVTLRLLASSSSDNQYLIVLLKN
jgi:photoactive yellow protein